MTATEAQKMAVAAEGNVLVAAGAGAGKTSTLVERCVQRLVATEPRATLEEILMVTFTEAAAAEMRARVRNKLEEVMASTIDAALREHIEEQLALLDTANICTLHSFCLRLVRQHFHELEIDPQISVLDDAQAKLLQEEALDTVFQRHYTANARSRRSDQDFSSMAGRSNAAEAPSMNAGAIISPQAGSSSPEAGNVEEQVDPAAARERFSEAVLKILQNHGGGKEGPIRELIMRIHDYTQTCVDREAWFTAQAALFLDTEARQWREWLLEAARAWREEWLPTLRQLGNDSARKITAQLERATATTLEDFGAVLDCVPSEKEIKAAERPPARFFKEAAFLRGLLVRKDGIDPLQQDWEWVRHDMATLLDLAREFSQEYSAIKREQGAVDFHDLEQFALRLLWDREKDEPTALAGECRARIRYLFVDECQDINASQDAILRALSRAETPNRFLVGDVKQSIYRFRLADPRIFQQYQREWSLGEASAQVIALRENFRSRESLLDFFNALFSDLMHEEVGRVRFEEGAKLLYGARAERPLLSRDLSPGPRVHLHLRLKLKENSSEADFGDDVIAELTAAEQEARMVANALHELRSARHSVWNGAAEQEMDWQDVAVLLRAPSRKADIYAREFARQRIPLDAAQGNFFESLEIADLLNVLKVLDNPLQDVPLIALLHSPLCGFTADELAEVRLAALHGSFWAALQRFHEIGGGTRASSKAALFLERFVRWRRMARDASLSTRLQSILAETSYPEWLAAQEENPQRAAQREKNLRRLLTVAEQFDPFQRQGLTRFLRFVEAQQDVVSREPLTGSTNAVRLMSIHRSKGLEFPVVVVPDLNKPFNFGDLRGNVLLHSRYGLCPKVKAPGVGPRYPSAAHWLAAKAERAELLGEEMRLLYVALTRARDTLLLMGSTTESNAKKWITTEQNARQLLEANSAMAWLGPWFARNSAKADWLEVDGANELFSWRVYRESPLPRSNEVNEHGPRPSASEAVQTSAINLPADFENTCARILCEYPHAVATRDAAKTSVSSLRRKLRQADEEARPWLHRRLDNRSTTRLSAAAIGVAHHTFLEFAQLTLLTSAEAVAREATRLVEAGTLSEEEARHLNHNALAAFWTGEVGQRILSSHDVRRELAFTARFECVELQGLGLSSGPAPLEEFVIIQGVVDVAVIQRDEIWLLDFKTDDVSPAEVEAKKAEYRTQLLAYSAALERIYRRPVSQRWLHFLATGETAEV